MMELHADDLYFSQQTIAREFQDGSSVTDPTNPCGTVPLGVFRDQDGDWRTTNNRTYYNQRFVRKKQWFECVEISGRELRMARHKCNGNGSRPTFRGTARVFSCSDCSRQFNEQFKLLQHQKSTEHGPYRVYRCGECGQGFSSVSARDSHLTTHYQSCDDCGKTFRNAAVLDQHQREAEHGQYRVFRCRHCNAGYRSRADCQRHEQSTHFVSCGDCGREFRHVEHLRQHQEAKGHGPTCFECGRRFNSSRSREQHQQAVGHGFFEKPQQQSYGGYDSGGGYSSSDDSYYY